MASPATAAGGVRILAYALPQMGHLIPLMDIGAEAASRGHEVVVVSSECWRGKVEPGCVSRGLTFLGLQDGLTSEYIDGFGPENCAFHECGSKHTPLLRTVVRELQPQVLLGDLPSVAAQRVSKELGVPLVINNLNTMRFVTWFIPLLQNSCANYLIRSLLPDVKSLIQLFGTEIGPALKKTYVLTHSAYGFEKPYTPAPNFVMTGPVAKRGDGGRRISKSDHPDLCDWLDRARAGNKPVVYVSTGTVIKLDREKVTALFEGLGRSDCWVIWSLKAEPQQWLPSPVPENFFVRDWQPENEIMSLGELKAVLTHCGWGGMTACLMNGKPVVAYPWFGDQPNNARLIESLGCGIKLRPATATADDVCKATTEILTNQEKFAAAAAKMREAFLATPGAAKAVEVLELAARPDAEFPVQGAPWHRSRDEVTVTCWPCSC